MIIHRIKFLAIIIIPSFVLTCCNSGYWTQNKQQKENIHRYQLYGDTVPESIDSAKIIMSLHNIEFIIRYDKRGHAINSIGKSFELSEENCNEILADLDTIFIKKLSPIELYKTWHPYVSESDEIPIEYDITIYSNGDRYHTRILYLANQGHYQIEYSLVFRRLAQILYILGGTY